MTWQEAVGNRLCVDAVTSLLTVSHGVYVSKRFSLRGNDRSNCGLLFPRRLQSETDAASCRVGGPTAGGNHGAFCCIGLAFAFGIHIHHLRVPFEMEGV